MRCTLRVQAAADQVVQLCSKIDLHEPLFCRSKILFREHAETRVVLCRNMCVCVCVCVFQNSLHKGVFL